MNKTQWQCLLAYHENNSQFIVGQTLFYLSMVTQEGW